METLDNIAGQSAQDNLDHLFRGDFRVTPFAYVSQAWQLFRKEPGKYIGFSLILVLIYIIFNLVSNLAVTPIESDPASLDALGTGLLVILFSMVFSILLLPLYAGYVIAGLKQLSGKQLEFRDFFAGYRQAGPIILNAFGVAGVVVASILIVGLVLGIPALIYFIATAHVTPRWYSELYLLAFIVLQWGVMAYVSVLCTFSQPLVIDRRMRVWQAIKTSGKVVSRHWFSVFGLLIVISAISMLGVLALVIGILVSSPVAGLMYAVAYKDIFGISRDDW